MAQNQQKNKDLPLIGYAGEPEVTALLELLGMVAKAGGHISKNQIQELERFMHSHLNEAQMTIAKSAFRNGKELNATKGMVTTRAFKLYGLDGQRWLDPILILDILLRTAFASGNFSSTQEYLIDCTRLSLAVHKRAYWILRDTLGERMGVAIKREGNSFARAEAQNTKQSKQKTPQSDAGNKKIKSVLLGRAQALAILELENDADVLQIKSAHRALVKLYHPDLAANNKASDDVLQKTIKRFCEIQEAYEFLMESAY